MLVINKKRFFYYMFMEIKSLSSKERYKKLRILASQGIDIQNSIFNEYGINIDSEEIEECLKYLINLSIANTMIQAEIFKILPQITCNNITGKFLMILSNNILSDSFHLRSRYISDNPAIVHYCIDSIVNGSDEIFE